MRLILTICRTRVFVQAKKFRQKAKISMDSGIQCITEQLHDQHRLHKSNTDSVSNMSNNDSLISDDQTEKGCHWKQKEYENDEAKEDDGLVGLSWFSSLIIV